MLLGSDGQVEHRENGVKFCFDVRLSMFSSGNGTEKQRMVDCVNRALRLPSLPLQSRGAGLVRRNRLLHSPPVGPHRPLSHSLL